MKNIQYIIKTYGLDPKTQCLKKINRGISSENYILGVRRPEFFLKEYRPGKWDEVPDIHRIMRILQKHVPIPQPLKNKKGASYGKNKKEVYALFPFINARHISRNKLGATAIRSMAHHQAKIHQVPTKIIPRLPVVNQRWDDAEFLEKAYTILAMLEKMKRTTTFDRMARRGLRKKIELVEKNTVAFKDLGLHMNFICHGDYQASNMFFTKDDKVQWIFDWEKVGKGSRAFEVLQTMEYDFFDGVFSRKNKKDAFLFLHEYTKVFPLGFEELRTALRARLIRHAHSLWIEKDFYLENNPRGKKFLAEQYRTINFYENNLETFALELKKVLVHKR